MKVQGIYSITHTASGRVYVGSAVDMAKRWRAHKGLLDKGTHHAIRLCRAWRKYGPEAFVFALLEAVLDTAELTTREQHWIDSLGAVGSAGYNSSPKAGSTLGYKHSLETRANMSAAHKGNPCWNRGIPATAEARAKMSTAVKARMTPEVKARLAAQLQGRVPSAETLAKRSAALKGHHTSAETRAKISAAHKGRKATAETRAILSVAFRGRTTTAETKAKLSLAMTGRTFTPETRAKLSAAAKKRQPSTTETRAKISATLKGRKLGPPTEAHRAALSVAGMARQALLRAEQSPLDQPA